MQTLPKIAIVIVNYKTPELVADCLASLRDSADHMDLSVFIGDADSQDGSVEKIRDTITTQGLTWAQCFAIGRNGGFAFGNNAVLTRCVLSEPAFTHVYFLNPDTYIRPDAIAALVAFLDAHPRVGIAGSRLEDPDGSLRSYGFRAPVPWREFFRGLRIGALDKLVPQAAIKIENLMANQQVDWVTGASFMVHRDILDSIGLMDDGYFLYFEETDLMTRARKAGYEVWHVAQSRVVHLAGQATGVRTGKDMPAVQPLSPHWLASRRRYLRKHHGLFGFYRANMLFLLGDLLYRAHRIIAGRPIQDPPDLWCNYLGKTSTVAPRHDE